MLQATFRFYEELNDFLPIEKRKRDFSASFPQQSTIEDVMASLGVPDAAIDLILVNGQSVDLSYPLQGGERISVYPVFESLDIRSATHLRPAPLRDLRFVADGQLDELAKHLRLLGFDCLCHNDTDSKSLVDISVKQGRVLLTRSNTLLKHPEITKAVLVRQKDPKNQLKEILQRLDLSGAVNQLESTKSQAPNPK
jgi:hypothetical protein